jgi:hypothetical protein
VSIKVSRKVRNRKLKLATRTTSFQIAKGTTQRLAIKVSKRQYRMLRRAKRMNGKATTSAHDGTGQRKTTTGTVTLKSRFR